MGMVQCCLDCRKEKKVKEEKDESVEKRKKVIEEEWNSKNKKDSVEINAESNNDIVENND